MPALDVNPFAAPDANAMWPDEGDFFEHAWRQDDFLVVKKNAELPPICLVTNTPAGERRVKQRFAWRPRGVMFLGVVLLITAFPLFVLFALISPCLTHRGTLRCPVSDEVYERWRRGNRASWLAVFVGVSLVILGISGASPDTVVPALLMLFAGFGVFILAANMGSLLGFQMSAYRVSRHYLWIRGVHPMYLARCRDIPPQMV